MISWLNNRYVQESDANISAFDRGFLYGEGLFETIRTYQGKLYAFDEHMARLRRGCRLLALPLGHTRDRILNVARGVIARNSLSESDAYLRITVTRGVTNGPRDFQTKRATCLIHCRPVDLKLQGGQRARGMRLVTVPFKRGLLAELKHTSYLPSLFAMRRAARSKVDEPVFTDDDGNLLEGATSNIFLFDGCSVTTPPASEILPGIMRRHVIEALRNEGVKVHEGRIHASSLRRFDCGFITNSIIELMPIKSIDDVTLAPRRADRFFAVLRRHIERQLSQKAENRESGDA